MTSQFAELTSNLDKAEEDISDFEFLELPEHVAIQVRLKHIDRS